MVAKKSRPLMGGIRVAIVDDHPSVREGLRVLLHREGGFTVCGEAGTIPEAIKMIGEECPDVAIVDISLGNDTSLELIRRLKDRNETLRILVWSMFDDMLY